jgi:hypothetical protein
MFFLECGLKVGADTDFVVASAPDSETLYSDKAVCHLPKLNGLT